MYCDKCGSEVSEKDMFCPMCGERLELHRSDDRNSWQRQADSNNGVSRKNRWYKYNWSRVFHEPWKGVGIRHHLAWTGLHLVTVLVFVLAIGVIRFAVDNNQVKDEFIDSIARSDPKASNIDYSDDNLMFDSIIENNRYTYKEQNEIEVNDNSPDSITKNDMVAHVESEDNLDDADKDESNIWVNKASSDLEIVSVGFGDIITFGQYEQDNNNGLEPIEWVVLKTEGDRALILSKYVLDSKCYNEERDEVTWENCSLRRWLNDDFYREAFTDMEKDRIQITKLFDETDMLGTSGDNYVEDKIFCLSVNDLRMLYSFEWWEDEEQYGYCGAVIAEPTEYVLSRLVGKPTVIETNKWYEREARKYPEYGVRNEILKKNLGKTSVSWWLRAPTIPQRYKAYVVFADGRVGRGTQVNIDSASGVRPALWISIK